MQQGELPLVHVRVTANVDSMRRGWTGELPLTERVEALSMAGYLQILGHVNLGVAPVAVAPLPVVEPPAPVVDVKPEPIRSKRPSRRRPTITEVDGGGSPGSP